VVAVGTTVVRALEGAAAGGELRAGAGVTDLRLDADSRPRVVDGLLTGIHEPGTSHFALLGAFAPAPLLARAWSHAEASGYLGHEFGDSSLVLSGAVLR
jgi:S-adenosylmethionine:tRNA ribosyltransferase-isomerase